MSAARKDSPSRAEADSCSSELNQRLESIRSQGLYRELRRLDSAQTPRVLHHGRELLSFASNDYLGLSQHSRLKEAAIRATEQYGVGSGASRLISGSLAPHHELEEALAAFKGTEAALSFATGYGAAIGAICALMDKDDVVILDHLVHASIVDAARLAAAKLRVFDHNDLNDLEHLLRWADTRRSATRHERSKRPQILVVTESVFSMDGDQAPLREIVDLKERCGAWLMVDEAHATGLFGKNGSGLAEERRLGNRIEVQMGTLGKAVGAAGGYICGSKELIDYLLNRARAFIFSTAPPPSSAAAARAGVQVIQAKEGEKLRRRLWDRVAQTADGLTSLPLRNRAENGLTRTVGRSCATSAILPIIIGDERKAVQIAEGLRKRGLFVPAIRYPSVARSQARLRVTISAAHTEADIAQLLDGLQEVCGAGA